MIETDDGPAEVGRLVIVGETERNVRDILAESGGDPEARSERDEAALWLREYLIQQGGSAKASDILKAARADGIAEATLKRAGVATTRQGFGQGSVGDARLVALAIRITIQTVQIRCRELIRMS